MISTSQENSCSIANAAISPCDWEAVFRGQQDIGNLSYNYKQLFRKNEDYGRKTDIQPCPPVSLGVDAMEQSTLLGSRRDGMAIISKMRCS